jgi:hypothetical protein
VGCFRRALGGAHAYCLCAAPRGREATDSIATYNHAAAKSIYVGINIYNDAQLARHHAEDLMRT